ncbi:hypothetical protein [Clostridium botulinum]|uniref:Uncharacterized protein n=1 Tax=Clostridium botulinum TaxID=1491 RepID=A0A0L9YAX4_CLOBO|nr:hypothetical protein [Clostridium botulinum]KOM88798.1 hypothetical protein ACP51_06105 [Clostridium botulinum]KOR57635.1 hypothetical protein ADT22_12795 [Clostridium botulinum]NFE58206.1 hypothetical protein [Clostridium botulinum]NFE94542.1 hypothetical protein [Clostridium botulinum]NFF87679.1 hypothetical protein [Clostridium botulinum]
MNLLDIKDEGNKLNKLLIETKEVMNQIVSISDSKESMKVELFKKAFSAEKAYQNGHNANFVTEVETIRSKYCNNFISDLRKIKFTKSIIELTSISEKFVYYNFQYFKNEFIKLIDMIDDYTAYSSGVDSFEEIEKLYNKIKFVIDLYEKIKININKINELAEVLSPGIEDCIFKIRFMNENKSIYSLKDNILLIENIYNNVNKLVGNTEEDLKYYRAESGSFLLYLGGCVTTLLTIKPLLEFAYKIYSEQLSPKAKIELELKKDESKLSNIKVRGEYLKLLKDATESKEISSLKISDKQQVLNIIGDLDKDIKDLFCKNPFIKLNDKELGPKENSNDNIPIVLLEEKNENIESLDQLEEIACDNVCGNGNTTLEE